MVIPKKVKERSKEAARRVPENRRQVMGKLSLAGLDSLFLGGISVSPYGQLQSADDVGEDE